jgi:small subunit ribosomal protein S16
LTETITTVATRIRLARGGRKKRPYYRIVVADSHAPRDGRFIERIGRYDPLLPENKVIVNVERVNHWLDVGARPSETVSRLLTLQGIEHALVVVPEPKAPPAQSAGEPAKAAKGGKGAKAEPKAESARSVGAPAEARGEDKEAVGKEPSAKAEAQPEETPAADAPAEATGAGKGAGEKKRAAKAEAQPDEAAAGSAEECEADSPVESGS